MKTVTPGGNAEDDDDDIMEVPVPPKPPCPLVTLASDGEVSETEEAEDRPSSPIIDPIIDISLSPEAGEEQNEGVSLKVSHPCWLSTVYVIHSLKKACFKGKHSMFALKTGFF